MLPTQGQGASQTIEDAEALGAFFDGIDEPPSADELSVILEVNNVSQSEATMADRLQHVFQARYSRVSLIQAYSRQAAKPAAEKDNKTVNL